MKITRIRILALLIAFALGSGLCLAGNKPKPAKPAPAAQKPDPNATPEEKSAQHRAEKKAAKPTGTGDTIPAGYPLTTCVVCGAQLKFGTLYTFTYHRDDKPDCTVVLHDKSCVRDFEKNPDKYIDMVFAAAAAKNKK